jgi:hypothetical protein
MHQAPKACILSEGEVVSNGLRVLCPSEWEDVQSCRVGLVRASRNGYRRRRSCCCRK